jgi:hypothetical protein
MRDMRGRCSKMLSLSGCTVRDGRLTHTSGRRGQQSASFRLDHWTTAAESNRAPSHPATRCGPAQTVTFCLHCDWMTL